MKQWEISRHFAGLGKKGGIARANKLSPERRKEIASLAGKASGIARKKQNA